MTLQELKENRNVIIATIEEKFSKEDVKEVMNIIAYNAEFKDNLNDLLEESFEMFEERVRPAGRKKDSLLTQMKASYELNNNIRYNQSTKRYEKY